jgi:hypothetical protein
MRRPFVIVLFGSLLAAMGLSSVRGMAAVLPPSGIAPGSQYQLMFVTRDTRDGTSANIADYNEFVTSEAVLSSTLPQGVTWTAIASTSTVNAVDNAPSSALPVFNTMGIEIVAANLYGTVLPLSNPIAFDQFGASVFHQNIWTGSNADGTVAIGHAMGSSEPRVGDALDPPIWLQAGIGVGLPASALSLYALSSPITFVPEPSTLALAALGFAALVAWRWRRR